MTRRTPLVAVLLKPPSAASAAAAAAAEAAVAGAAALASATSAAKTRPPGPVPTRLDTSMPFSSASCGKEGGRGWVGGWRVRGRGSKGRGCWRRAAGSGRSCAQRAACATPAHLSGIGAGHDPAAGAAGAAAGGGCRGGGRCCSGGSSGGSGRRGCGCGLGGCAAAALAQLRQHRLQGHGLEGGCSRSILHQHGNQLAHLHLAHWHQDAPQDGLVRGLKLCWGKEREARGGGEGVVRRTAWGASPAPRAERRARTSTVALSVSTLAMQSPALITSPSFLHHSAMTPWVMVAAQGRDDAGGGGGCSGVRGRNGAERGAARGGQGRRAAALASAPRDDTHGTGQA